MANRHRIAAISRISTYLAAQGIAPGEVLARLGLPRTLLLQSHTWVDRETSLRLAEEAARMAGDPLAAVRIVEMTPFTDYGVLGDSIAGAHDLRSALVCASLGVHSLETGTIIRLEEEGDVASVSFEFAGRLEADPCQHLQGGLMFLKKILDLASEPVPVMACLPHERSRCPRSELDRWFTAGVRFGAERACVRLDRSALGLALQLPATAGEGPADDVLVRRAAEVIARMLPLERPTVPKVAMVLLVSPRTLLRRLHAWGVGFRELVDQCRYSLALRYLGRGDRPITDIAFRLGYSDASHFTRAFRRWTGMSPSQATADVVFALEAQPQGEPHPEARAFSSTEAFA